MSYSLTLTQTFLRIATPSVKQSAACQRTMAVDPRRKMAIYGFRVTEPALPPAGPGRRGGGVGRSGRGRWSDSREKTRCFEGPTGHCVLISTYYVVSTATPITDYNAAIHGTPADIGPTNSLNTMQARSNYISNPRCPAYRTITTTHAIILIDPILHNIQHVYFLRNKSSYNSYFRPNTKDSATARAQKNE